MHSVVMLWMEYSALTDKLAKAAEDEGDIEAAWALAKIWMAYRDATYQAVRLRVDQVTLNLISKPVSETYTRQNRMDLETVTVSPAGLQMLREFNKAIITARTKAAVNMEAAVPKEYGYNCGSSEQPLSTRAKQRAATLKKKPEEQKGQHNSTQGAASSATDTRGRGQPAGGKYCPSKRPVPIWFRPMKAAGRWGELRADAREAAQLRYGVHDQPDREVAPFRLPGIRLSASESVEMEAIIEKQLNGQIWRELSLEQGRREQYVSRDFKVQNTDGTMRGVADLSHLPDHYDAIATKAETLEGFSASLMSGDRMLSMDLRSGYNHFRLYPDMRKCFNCEDCDGRWHRALF
jgi:head-tail adaptor